MMKNIPLVFGMLFLSACASTAMNPLPDGKPLSIKQNQKVYVEIITSNNSVTSIKQVSTIEHPDTTMVFHFMKTDSGMMLSIKNPTKFNFKYNIDVVDYQRKLYPTSSCPVRAGMSAFESWPQQIPEIQVKNFQVLMHGSSMACVY